MGAEHKQSHCLKVVFLRDITDREKIVEALAHFLVVHVDKAVVHPVVDVWLACGAFALGNLIFVVREQQVLAAAVNVKILSKVFHTHRGAFNVPTGASFSPRTIPGWLAGLLCFPQGEILRGFLFRFNVQTVTGAHLAVFGPLSGKLAVSWKSGNPVVYIAGRNGVGVAVFDQTGNQSDDLPDMLRGPGMNRGGADAQRLRVHIVFRNETVCQFLYGNAFLVGAADHLVVDVCEVLHKCHVVAFPFQLPPEHIEGDKGPGVTDVKIIVYGRTAGINAYLSFMNRSEGFFFSRHAVVNLHG